MNDDKFDEISQEIETPVVVVFTQQPDELNPTFDLVGEIDIDEAIAITVKGLFLMVFTDLGVFDVDDEEDGELED